MSSLSVLIKQANTIDINEKVKNKINKNNCSDSLYNKIESDYDDTFSKLSDNFSPKKETNIYKKCSECPDIPDFPSGNTPPDSLYFRSVYLNLVANRSLDKDLNKLA
jgi:hypothetical protein